MMLPGVLPLAASLRHRFTSRLLDGFDQWHFKRFLVPPPDWGPAPAETADAKN